jgi:hypothetical protein
MAVGGEQIADNQELVFGPVHSRFGTQKQPKKTKSKKKRILAKAGLNTWNCLQLRF